MVTQTRLKVNFLSYTMYKVNNNWVRVLNIICDIMMLHSLQHCSRKLFLRTPKPQVTVGKQRERGVSIKKTCDKVVNNLWTRRRYLYHHTGEKQGSIPNIQVTNMAQEKKEN